MEKENADQLSRMQEELKVIALFLCDDDEKKADDLVRKTNELAWKYDPKKEFHLWVLSIMKHTYYINAVKELQVRTQ